MGWGKTKDALLTAAGGMVLWLIVQMRGDFQDMTRAVTALTVKIEVIAEKLSEQARRLDDHEHRIRRVEKSPRDKS